MAVPDNTYFGPNESGEGVTYGDLRNATQERQIELLTLRLDVLLVKQIDELGKDLFGERKVYATFPLAILTCIAIETIGQVFFLRDNKFVERSQSYCFIQALNKLDPTFSRKLSKQMKQKIELRFPNEEIHTCSTWSEIIYAYFRNTFIHGYRGRAVYLEENIESWIVEDGFLVINPYWFWNQFKNVYKNIILEMNSNKESKNPFRISAFEYINDLLK